MTYRVTRRQALADALAATAGALLVTACGASVSRTPATSGSTLQARWIDPQGIGLLRPGPGEPLADRTDLAPRQPLEHVIGTLAHITDAHVLDASSPARATFLDRLGPPFQSTFRPHETLTTQVLAGTVAAIRHLGPDAVIQGGDLIDNAQRNELEHALSVLTGGTVHPGSSPHGYYGVQLASNPDPFYYRPDLDAPRHPDLLQEAVRPFASPGLKALQYPVLGDHDVLVQGEIVPTAETRKLALGNQALWELLPGLHLPPGARSEITNSPDGPPSPGLVSAFIAQALKGPKQRVPADRGRREMAVHEVVARLQENRATANADRIPANANVTPANANRTPANSALDYHGDVGPNLRLIVLDLARRKGGSGGLVRPDQPPWLEQQLAAAKNRWVIAVSHQPLASSVGGDQLLALLDRHPRVIAAVSGHTHRNEIMPRSAPNGGYWLISTASLIDYPQQARAIQLIATHQGGVALRTWMLDHVFPGNLGTISRQLSYLDAQGGRPEGFAGTRLDRNVTLYVR
ncbi:MAG: metallophosphoesterase [Solirubrobacterales bacterium]|nr:metallophosphoesterase [Solirubrobacterales bacterium]